MIKIKFIFSKLKKILFLLFFMILAFAVWQWNWVFWGFTMAKGGLNVAFNTRPLPEVLNDRTVPDSLKKRIRFVAEIKKYAIDSLGLKDNPKVYQTLFDQQGKPLVHLLTVAEKYELKAQTFYIPILDIEFAYKGFFDKDLAEKEEKLWQTKGYDTDMGEGIAYSTLGWLPEPILSSMLYYSDGRLASLIIHEMTHGTIFVKGDHELSENLANFVGDYGAKRFLKAKYGDTSAKYLNYATAKFRREKIIKHLNRGTHMLDSLYQTFNSNFSESQKHQLKYKLIEQIIRSEDSLNIGIKKTKAIDKNNLPNNAFFVGFKTYNAKQNEFEDVFEKKFHQNFPAFLNYFKQKYN